MEHRNWDVDLTKEPVRIAACFIDTAVCHALKEVKEEEITYMRDKKIVRKKKSCENRFVRKRGLLVDESYTARPRDARNFFFYN